MGSYDVVDVDGDQVRAFIPTKIHSLVEKPIPEDPLFGNTRAIHFAARNMGDLERPGVGGGGKI